MKKKLFIFFLILITAYLLLNLYFKNKNLKSEKIDSNLNEIQTNSNIIKDVNYISRDNKGNEYIINALEGEIDIKNNHIIFLKNVVAIIKLNNKSEIKIKSDFGKYNILNNDTIFNQNVISTYLDNKITSKYLDFSLERNTMFISQNVIFTSNENTLNADVIEMNIKTKDTKIFMYDSEKQVKIKNKS